MTIKEISEKVAKGELTTQEATELWKKAGSGLYFSDTARVITPEKEAAVIVSDDPAKVTGWGRLDIGIGDGAKIYVKDGNFGFDTGFDLSGHPYHFYIGGKDFWVDGDHLVAIPGAE